VDKDSKKEIDSFLLKCEKYLKNEGKDSFSFIFVLTKPINEGLEIYTMAVDRSWDEVVFFQNHNTFAKEMSSNLCNCYEDILLFLTNGFRIERMSSDAHYWIWNEISVFSLEDIKEVKKGVRKYINYCTKNKITKQLIEDKMGLETPDIDAIKMVLDKKSLKNLNKCK